MMLLLMITLMERMKVKLPENDNPPPLGFCLFCFLFVFLVVFLSAMMTLVEKMMVKLPENGNLPPLGTVLSPGSALCVLSPTTSDNHMIVTIYLLRSFDEL